MTRDKTLKSPARRAFFRKAGVGVGAAGVVALGANGAAVAEAPKNAPSASGYRETDHVKTAYRLARF